MYYMFCHFEDYELGKMQMASTSLPAAKKDKGKKDKGKKDKKKDKGKRKGKGKKSNDNDDRGMECCELLLC